ncbi:MAG TPA: hypothetical protein DCZ95_07515 [Verrucomicrobia bacterium]|nr:MAG: hypothetical protein A2X46_16400 [Lentisphaerae bacterium GWF2_57_35]HBA83923.1 hypothetical protein [Verrucomicrobiota bacterium]
MSQINDCKTESPIATMTPHPKSDAPSCRIPDQIYDVLCAIIEQACADCRQLAKAGYIVHGRITPLADQLTKKKNAFGMTKIDIVDLLHFFYSDSFDRLCTDGLRMEINPDAVRDRLGLSPRLRGQTCPPSAAA